jgi:Response regulator containing CheY-like receiver, AAA-type ATPase, and DNA-binding domains
LREREDDVLVLAAHFIEHFNHQLRKNIVGLSDEAIGIFRYYSWPGNVRELRNVIERAMILEDGSFITAQWLPHSMTDFILEPKADFAAAELLSPLTVPASLDIKLLFPLPPSGISLEAVEQSLLLQALELTQGNQTKAAELLQISRDQFRYRLKKIESVPAVNPGQ